MSDTPEVQEYTPEEQALRDALRSVNDPELDMNIVELGLVRQLNIQPDFTEIKMIMTTPFCPYGPAMLEMIKQKAQEGLNMPVTIELGMERWDFSLMEDPGALDWGMYA